MSNYKNVLAFDTAMSACGAGLWTGGRGFRRSEVMAAGHGERLVPMINEVMAEAGVAFDALDAIVTTLGPGAFTGLRIAMSAAKGFGLALGIPVFGITTLQALALQFATQKNSLTIAAIIETKREDFYFERFSPRGESLSEPRLLDREGIEALVDTDPHVLIGDGVKRYKGIASGCDVIDCEFLARALAEDSSSRFFTRAIEPVYLRGADVSQSKRVQRVLAT